MFRIVSHLLRNDNAIVFGLGGALAYKSYEWLDLGTISFPTAFAGVIAGITIMVYESALYMENKSRH